jgi:hypothetical protein
MRAVLWLIVLLVTATNEARAFGAVISATEFFALDKEAQKDYLCSALADRERRLSNIEAEIEITRYNAELDGTTVGKTVQELGRDLQHIWKQDNSYRFRQEVFPPRDATRLVLSNSNYISSEGRSTMFAEHRDMKGKFARIDNRQDPVVRNNHFAFFLGGEIDETRPSHIRYIIDNAKRLSVDPVKLNGKDMILASIEYDEPRDQAHHARRFWLDPARDLLMLKVEYQWDRHATGVAFDHRDTQVSDATEIGGT